MARGSRQGAERRRLDNPTGSIRIEIYDQEYHVKGSLNSAYLEDLARYVDGKMRSIATRSHNVDSLRVAVLAALNIADEYHQMKTRYEATTRQVQQKVGEYSEALDRLLKPAV
ncbi:MAG: cell division protein ZapA [Acidobacteria bacterium]|nr:MAG: cell division protein ZapA [Acidobacteriota bacterium]